MSDQEHHARRHAEPQARAVVHGRPEEQAERLIATERSLIGRLTRVLRFADFVALLMVAATAFSAYATWRTAQVTSHIFALEERPFLGIENVRFEQGDTVHPRAAVEYRNFGKIPASGAIVTVVALVDGKRLADSPNEMSSVSAGVLSPGVPHYFYTYLPGATYKAVLAGQSSLMLHVRAEYKGPDGEPFCYSERVVFDYRSEGFRPVGGSDRCSRVDIF
jgi:hypothetical protein